jgi:hypothetical protein
MKRYFTVSEYNEIGMSQKQLETNSESHNRMIFKINSLMMSSSI